MAPEKEATASPDDIIIAIVGAVGNGKTTFISDVLGKNINTKHDLKASPTKCHSYAFFHPGCGKRVVLIDTIGTEHPSTTAEDVLKLVGNEVLLKYEAEVKLTGVIYVHHVTAVDMKGPDWRVLAMFKKLCGENYYGQIALSTTMWDKLDSRDIGVKNEKELLARRDCWAMMAQRGSSHFQHDNSQEGALQVINTLIRKRGHEIVDTRREIVPEDEPLPPEEPIEPEKDEEVHKIKADYDSQLDDLTQLKQETFDTLGTELLVDLSKAYQDISYQLTNQDKALSRIGTVFNELSENLQAVKLFENERQKKATTMELRQKRSFQIPFRDRLLRSPRSDAFTEIHQGSQQSNVNIAILGLPGVGKSSLISHLVGNSVPIGDGINRCTQQVEVYPYMWQDLNINLIDTPGIGRPSPTETDIMQQIKSRLNQSLQRQVQLDGIIYLHRVSDSRYSESARTSLYALQRLIGTRGVKNIILAPTMWENIELSAEVHCERELTSMINFWGEMVENGMYLLRHQNNRDSTLRIMDFVIPRIEMSHSAPLQATSPDADMAHADVVEPAGPDQLVNMSLLEDWQTAYAQVKDVAKIVEECVAKANHYSLQKAEQYIDEVGDHLRTLKPESRALINPIFTLLETRTASLNAKHLDQVSKTSQAQQMLRDANKEHHAELAAKALTIRELSDAGQVSANASSVQGQELQNALKALADLRKKQEADEQQAKKRTQEALDKLEQVNTTNLLQAAEIATLKANAAAAPTDSFWPPKSRAAESPAQARQIAELKNQNRLLNDESDAFRKQSRHQIAELKEKIKSLETRKMLPENRLTERFTMALAGDLFCYVGPAVSYWYCGLEHEKGNKLKDASIGTNGSWYYSSQNKQGEINISKSDNIEIEYPGISADLRRHQPNWKEMTVSLGLNGCYFIISPRGKNYKFNSDKFRSIEEQIDKVERVWFGYRDSYVLLKSEGTRAHWNLRGHYPKLDAKLKAREVEDKILGIALNILEPHRYMLVTSGGLAADFGDPSAQGMYYRWTTANFGVLWT